MIFLSSMTRSVKKRTQSHINNTKKIAHNFCRTNTALCSLSYWIKVCHTFASRARGLGTDSQTKCLICCVNIVYIVARKNLLKLCFFIKIPNKIPTKLLRQRTCCDLTYVLSYTGRLTLSNFITKNICISRYIQDNLIKI